MLTVYNAVQATYIVTLLLVLALTLSIRRRKSTEFFNTSVSVELKGLAILMVVFSHIGYFLVNDHRFLFPLSIGAGIGVDLFLLLSGFGLVMSALRKQQSLVQFYYKRLLKLFVPLWLTLALFLLLDYFVLHTTYGWTYVWQSFVGFFPHADIYHDLNSPLWYFTLILFYYLLFPLVFIKKAPWISALGIYVGTYALVYAEPTLIHGVLDLYRVHLMAFPLGMIIGNMFFYADKIKRLPEKLPPASYYFVMLSLVAVIAYTAYNSGVGMGARVQELISITTVLSIIVLFALKRFEIKLLYLFGIFSYEIYLLHWPLLYRYDIFFRVTPAWVALCLYLVLFLALGWIWQRFSKWVMFLMSAVRGSF